MSLKDGAIYRTPDGRRFRARIEPRRYDPEPAWTFVPVDLDDTNTDKGPSRDRLRKLLFLDQGKIVHFEFDTGKLVQDTGWTIADLWPE
jgi:hypothetical protein